MHRMLGDDRIASMYANEVIEASTRDGQNHHPMRVDVAHVTLGVAAAHDGAIDEALAYGNKALEGDRKSIPRLIMTSSDLADALRPHHKETSVAEYLGRLRALHARTSNGTKG